MHYSTKRQRFLVNQGYSYKVMPYIKQFLCNSIVCYYYKVVTKLAGLEEVLNASLRIYVGTCFASF